MEPGKAIKVESEDDYDLDLGIGNREEGESPHFRSIRLN